GVDAIHHLPEVIGSVGDLGLTDRGNELADRYVRQLVRGQRLAPCPDGVPIVARERDDGRRLGRGLSRRNCGKSLNSHDPGCLRVAVRAGWKLALPSGPLFMLSINMARSISVNVKTRGRGRPPKP